MQRIFEIFIKDFRHLKYFSIELKQKEKLNLNVLIGKNGSGKSTFLDVLYEMASCQNGNLISSTPFYILDKNQKVILGNRKPENLENVVNIIPEEKIWDRVIRFYTGNTDRCSEFLGTKDIKNLSFCRDDLKWVLSSIFLSGSWNNPKNKIVLEDIQNILFKDDLKFQPEQIWIDVKTENDDDFNKLLESLPQYQTISTEGNTKRVLWNINEIIFEKDHSISILENLLSKNNKFINTGFLYKKRNFNEEETIENYLPDETLSDGELGLVRRFSLVLLLRELKQEDQRCLVLLDEPETHFNENWKRHFIYLLEEALKETYHDLFIATHSAMLITDAKRDELYRFELLNNKIKTYPVSLNTFGANVIDIGQALFDLESDIGQRSKNEIQSAIDTNNKPALKNLLKQVGPGEWRWRIRAKLNEIEKRESCVNYKCKKDE